MRWVLGLLVLLFSAAASAQEVRREAALGDVFPIANPGPGLAPHMAKLGSIAWLSKDLVLRGEAVPLRFYGPDGETVYGLDFGRDGKLRVVGVWAPEPRQQLSVYGRDMQLESRAPFELAGQINTMMMSVDAGRTYVALTPGWRTEENPLPYDIAVVNDQAQLVEGYDLPFVNGLYAFDVAANRCEIAYADDRHIVHRYDVCAGRQIAEFSLPSWIGDVRYLPGQRLLLVVHGIGVMITDLDGNELARLSANERSRVALDPFARTYYTLDGFGGVARYALEDGALLIPGTWVPRAAYIPDIAVFGEWRAVRARSRRTQRDHGDGTRMGVSGATHP